MTSNRFRAACGEAGLYGAQVGLGIVVLAIANGVFVSSGSTVDLFIENHHLALVRLLDTVFFGSLITLISSLLGYGRSRGYGMTLSFVDLIATMCIMVGGQ